MKGIFIPNIEMPTNCESCPCKSADAFGGLGCQATGYIPLRKVNQDRPDWCPLVPVPEHGLIAREQILDAIRLELAQANACNDMDDYDAWIRIFDYVRKFPTIIPAEEATE